MDFFIPKRLPCSVCGLVSFRHEGWFQVVENRWLDHLKILSWHPSLATQKKVRSACCSRHLRVLIAHWLDQASLRLIPHAEPPSPITSDPALPDFSLDHRSAGHLVGELSIHRESLSRVWTGSAATLESILDALIPGSNECARRTLEFPLFASSPGPPHGLPLH